MRLYWQCQIALPDAFWKFAEKIVREKRRQRRHAVPGTYSPPKSTPWRNLGQMSNVFVRFSLRRRHTNISRFRWSGAKRSRRVRYAHDVSRIHQHLSRYSRRFIIVAIHKRLRDTKTRPIFRDRASISARVKGQSGNMRGVIPTCVIGFSSRDATTPPHTRS